MGDPIRTLIYEKLRRVSLGLDKLDDYCEAIALAHAQDYYQRTISLALERELDLPARWKYAELQDISERDCFLVQNVKGAHAIIEKILA
jgi:hypothetical protein